jgi:hypothetical protein
MFGNSYKRQERYQILSAVRRNMNFYHCPEDTALGYIKPEWAVYLNRFGVLHPGEEKWRRMMRELSEA